MQPIRRTIRPASRGFSLIEILVVLTIILLLMGIAFVTMGRSVTNARIAATKTTIAILDSALQRQFEALMQDFTTQERNPRRRLEWINIAGFTDTAGQLSPDSNNTSTVAAQAIVKLNRYIGTFPQRWEDMYGFDMIDDAPVGANTIADDAWDPRSPTYRTLMAGATKYGIKDPNDLASRVNNDDRYESAELLFLLIAGGPQGPEILNNLNARHIGDGDNDDIPEFLDDWGEPLRFYNTPTFPFATSSSDPTLATAQSLRAALFPKQTELTRNPLDPANSLGLSPYNVSGYASTNNGVTYLHVNRYLAPLIVSSGPDTSLGLIEPADGSSAVGNRTNLLAVPLIAGDANEALDNITNYQGAN